MANNIPDTSSDPNYLETEPSPDKDRVDYTFVERRAAILDMMFEEGHYRALPTTRELGDQFGVSHNTIARDIRRVKAWLADHLGEDIEAELEAMKNKAIMYYLENDQPHKAYYLLKNHAELMLDVGAIQPPPEQHQHEHVVAEAWRKSIEAENYHNPLYESDEDVIDPDAVTIDVENVEDQDSDD